MVVGIDRWGPPCEIGQDINSVFGNLEFPRLRVVRICSKRGKPHKIAQVGLSWQFFPNSIRCL
jgi:hypothetical protein